MDPKLLKEDGILGFSDEQAEIVAMDIYHSCWLSRDDPDAAFESVSDLEFDKLVFEDFLAEYTATESISTGWGDLINYKKEIKMAGNAMSKAAGSEINLLPGTDGYTTSAPRKKDGQYYTRATFAFSDGQAARILFYSPDKPEEKHKYPSNVVSFQIFLNKKDITASLVKGGGKDYGPRQFGKIIGKLIERNSEKFQQKNAEIKAQKAEMESLDKEASELDTKIAAKSSEATQAKERNTFLTKQRDDLKVKSEMAAATKAEAEKKQKAIDAENLRKEKEAAGKVKAEVDTGGPVETTSPRDELIRLLTDEIKQLKADPETPEFKLGLRVGKKKDGTAGKVSLDLKEVDVLTFTELDELKEKIEAIVKAHTGNYSFAIDKAEIKLKSTMPSAFDDGGIWAKSLAEIQAYSPGQIKDFYDDLENENYHSQKHILLAKYVGTADDVKEAEEILETHLREGSLSREIGAKRDALFARLYPKLLDMLKVQEPEPPTQEQVTDTGIAQAEPPPEEAAKNEREIGSEYKDREGVTKLITHEIDGKMVSAVQEKEYVHSAYLSGRTWINLPLEQKTLISEDDLKGAIAKSEEAYQVANDILDGNYDAQGPDKVDQLLDEIAEVIEDEGKLNQVADYYTALLSKKFAPQPATATA